MNPEPVPTGTSVSLVYRVVDLRRASIIGVRRLFAARELTDARDLGHAGKSVDPGESTEVGFTDGLQIQDGDDRGIHFLRDVGNRHLGALRRCRGAERGAGSAVDHRLRGDLRGKHASRQDAKPTRRAPRISPGVNAPVRATLRRRLTLLSGHVSAPLLS